MLEIARVFQEEYSNKKEQQPVNLIFVAFDLNVKNYVRFFFLLSFLTFWPIWEEKKVLFFSLPGGLNSLGSSRLGCWPGYNLYYPNMNSKGLVLRLVISLDLSN